jgi:2OG-Fe(II) oxygenase superfamily
LRWWIQQATSTRNLIRNASTMFGHLVVHGFYIVVAVRAVNGLLVQKSCVQSMVYPTSLRAQSPTTEVPIFENVEVLSCDPLVYVIPDLLSADECQAYVKRVEHLEAKQSRKMTRSNPPEVLLDYSKLWPLPFLSLLAGVPTLLHSNLHDTDFNELFSKILPPISIAMGISIVLAVAAVTIIRVLSDSSSRTSEAIALNQADDIEFIRQFVDRVSSVTDHAWYKWEAPVVTRYARGAIFAKHGDASPTRGSEWQGLGGQRVVTCICYLNTAQEGGGGETAFDGLNIKVRPFQGKALFFFPASALTLEADDRTLHESLPPLTDEKWIVQMFGRVGPRVPPPLGLPDSYGVTTSSA